jgi:hypothetical protein
MGMMEREREGEREREREGERERGRERERRLTWLSTSVNPRRIHPTISAGLTRSPAPRRHPPARARRSARARRRLTAPAGPARTRAHCCPSGISSRCAAARAPNSTRSEQRDHDQ